MTYVKNYPGGWQPGTGGGTPITHLALDHIETQYDEAASDLNTHKSDPTAHGRTGGILPLTQLPALPENYVWRGNSSNRPEAVSFDPSSAIPTGVICMWSGTLASIPSGWALCDGNNGTPNLLDRFVVGVPTNGTNPGATGGSTSKTTTGHKHAGSSGSAGSHGHSGSTSTSGSHGHSPSGHQIREGETPGSRLAIYSLSADGSHDHSVSISASGSHNHSVSIGTNTDTITDIRPKYYALAFIMKL